MHTRIAELARKVLDGGLLGRDEAAYLATVGRDDPEDVYDLFYWANKIRVRYVGRDVRWRVGFGRPVGVPDHATHEREKYRDRADADANDARHRWNTPLALPEISDAMLARMIGRAVPPGETR